MVAAISFGAKQSAVLLVLTTILITGCAKVKDALSRATIPDMGPKIPLTVKMEFDPSLTATRLPYINACNAPLELRIGPELEAVFLQAAGQNFRTIQFANAAPTGVKPDVAVQLTLQQSSLKIQTDGIYDRLPAELNLEAAVAFKDSRGALLGERAIRTTYREKLLLEPTQHRCDLVSIDAFSQNAAVSLAVQFIREARALLDPDGSLAAGQSAAPPLAQIAPPPPATAPPVRDQAVASPAVSTPPPAAKAPVTSPAVAGGTTVVPAVIPPLGAGSASSVSEGSLSFKATLLDENGNSVLEGGERVKVRVDVVNAGLNPAHGVKASLTGTPAVVAQFPSQILPVGDLQPGESRSIEFIATLPQTLSAQRAELVVAVASAAGGGTPASQTLVTSMRRADEPHTVGPGPGVSTKLPGKGPGSNPDDIDTIPQPSEGFPKSQALLLAVGIGSYRDEQIPGRKFAAQDAELVAGYFEALGGVSAENVRLLQDRHALRPDIEEAVLDWLPSRVSSDSVVIAYFSGQAMVSPSGETFLVPYEGTRTSVARLYPLKDLQAALGKLKTRLTLLIFDGSVLRMNGKTKGKGQAQPGGPQWEAGSRNIVRLIGTTGFQAGLEPDRLRHGLFTYYLLRGLRGEADEDQDGEVTLGELATFLQDAVPIAAKGTYRQEQQPIMVPQLPATSKRAALPLSRVANGQSP
jgi:hypothetical protein